MHTNMMQVCVVLWCMIIDTSQLIMKVIAWGGRQLFCRVVFCWEGMSLKQCERSSNAFSFWFLKSFESISRGATMVFFLLFPLKHSGLGRFSACSVGPEQQLPWQTAAPHLLLLITSVVNQLIDVTHCVLWLMSLFTLYFNYMSVIFISDHTGRCFTAYTALLCNL